MNNEQCMYDSKNIVNSVGVFDDSVAMNNISKN